MISSLRGSLSELFASYDTLADAQIDLTPLYPDDTHPNDVYKLTTPFENDCDLVKAKYMQILGNIERDIAMDKFLEVFISFATLSCHIWLRSILYLCFKR